MSLHAQQTSIAFERFTVADGLSSPVTNITQDHFGFLWLATRDGLNRFDGKNFVVYRNIAGDTTSLANNIINSLCVDHLGRVWAATNGGICYYDFEDDAFHSIDYPYHLERIDRHRVHAVTTDPHQHIWFATRTHIHQWQDGKLLMTLPLPDTNDLNIKYLYADPHDRIWIGMQSGIFVYRTVTGKLIYKKITTPFLESNRLVATVHPIIPYQRDTLLIGSWYGGVQKVWLENDQIQAIPFTDDSQSDARKHIIYGISPGPAGQYWIGSYGNGLSVLNTRTSTFTAHFHHDPSQARSLGNDYILDLFTDKSGILWIGHEAGLDKFDPFTQQFQSIPIPLAPGEFSVYRSPSSFLEDPVDPDQMWVTVSGAGIYKYHMTERTFNLIRHNPAQSQSLPDDQVVYLFKDRDGRHWVGYRSGVCVADDRLEKFSVPAIIKNKNIGGVHEILQARDGTFWWATFSKGIYHYDEVNQELTHYTNDPSNANSIPDNRVFCMLLDHQGFLWIGTQNRGLCRLDPQTGNFIFFEHDKKKSGTIPDNGIYDLHEDDQHHLWIATENGLAEMDLADFSIRTYTTQDGLCNSDIFSITPDHLGHYWLATNNGLSRFDPKTKKFKNYFINDGLPTNSLGGAAYCAANGQVFFGTSGMITYCDPEAMNSNRMKPPVVITDFRVFGRRLPVMREGADLAPIRLSYKQDMITFDFAALNFTNADLNQYAYRLEGYDDQWIYCGNRQSATFTNLDGGTYTFHVKAANSDGIWNETGAKARIIIKPPFWETWWFYVLSFCTVAGLLYIAYRFRIEQLMKLQQVRMRISRDLHDDIGSTLSSINMISSMANQKTKSEGKPNEWFQTISNASHQAMELMNDIVWSINPKNDRMEMILIRMRQYASEILEAAQIPFTLDMDESCRHLVLPIEKRKDFYLIFKEAINNLAKYSRATQADILVKYANRQLQLHIRDNGIGFDPEYLHHGNGIKNMKARSNQLGGQMHIHSTQGKGTQIELEIPVTP
jgi:ligand-binding sensor domain-containing protein/signal transduction histidine kinase